MNTPDSLTANGRTLSTRQFFSRTLLLGLLWAWSTSAATLYVWEGGSGHNVNTWAGAARTIQEAVDAARPGDTVLVTNGVYATGRRVARDGSTNRVVVDRAIEVRSVNGPAVTVIRGYQVPDTTNGDGAVRCMYLTDGAVLSGFTLTGGATRASVLPRMDTSGGGIWCASTNVTITNTILIGNSAAWYGGGAYQGTLNNCLLIQNSASVRGGGAASATLSNCRLTDNSTDDHGGGAFNCTLNNCTLVRNSARYGGGVFNSRLNNCVLYDNLALIADPNYRMGTLHYCCTTPLPESGEGNISADPQLTSDLHLFGDSPCRGAGAAVYATGTDLDGESWLSPPSMGCDEYRTGTITGAVSVAIGTLWTNVPVGVPLNLTALIEGRISSNIWDLGNGMNETNRNQVTHTWFLPGEYPVVLTAYNEDHPAGVEASLIILVIQPPSYFVSASSSNPIPPYTSWDTAAQTIQDAVDAVTSPDAMVLVTNGVYAVGGRAVDGPLTNRVVVDRPMTVRSVNGPEVTVIQGSQATVSTNGDGAVRCVYLADRAVLEGFTLTRGGTGDSQDVILGLDGGGVWCATTNAMVSACVLSSNSAFNGGGASGGAFSGCIFTDNTATYGGGGGAYRSVLSRCTLAGNVSRRYGGGAYISTLSHCTVTGNAAMNGAGAYRSTLDDCVLTTNSSWSDGAGVYGGVLRNCILTGNFAGSSSSSGGGARHSTLINCVLTKNSAPYGGDASECSLTNCIVFDNGRQNYAGTTMDYCCTTSLPYAGTGNITADPLFVNPQNGDFRLQANSPCINTGHNAYVSDTTDLDGNPRIAGGTVDIGAYEFQAPTSFLSYAWLQQYGLPVDGSADFTDNDADSLNNWQEWQCDTLPTNAASVLRLLAPSESPDGVTVTWESMSTRSYVLERSTNLVGAPVFQPLATGIPGQSGTTTFLDANAPDSIPRFYRVSTSR